MRLPFADSAHIDPNKVQNYLLSLDHPTGRHKATVFYSVGYSALRWRELTRDLLHLARTSDAVPIGTRHHGDLFTVRGILKGPSGDLLAITTVWIRRPHEPFTRFVTAFPWRSP